MPRDPFDVAPDDLDELAVHADALLEEGHFVGEIAAAQLAIHRLGPDGDATLRARLALDSRRVLTAHHEEIFGELAPHALSVVPKSLAEPTGQFAACTASWRLGVIDEVALTASSKSSLEATITALAKVPAARFLRSIVCGSSAPPSARWEQPDYAPFVAALAAHGASFPRLRSLFLGDVGGGTVARTAGELEPLYPVLPQLETLRVRANEVEVGSLALPKLRELDLHGAFVSIGLLRRIVDARLVELVALSVEHGAFRNDLAEAVAVVAELPRLKKLGLPSWRGDGKVDALIRLPWMASLVELDISHNDLASELGRLVDEAHRFAHLERLDLRENGFNVDRDSFLELRRRLPRADMSGQRYVAGEG
jgi:hypothetical protein